jgi:hypothetical protein
MGWCAQKPVLNDIRSVDTCEKLFYTTTILNDNDIYGVPNPTSKTTSVSGMANVSDRVNSINEKVAVKRIMSRVVTVGDNGHVRNKYPRLVD